MESADVLTTFMEFAGITDASIARRLLEQAGGDANAAAALYLDSLGRDAAGAPAEAPEEELRAPDTQYTQTLLSPSPNSPVAADGSAGYPTQHASALAIESSAGTTAFRGLFELPDGLCCKEPFARARELCLLEKKWLLVNIQQVDSFESLRLNRDVWKAEVVMDLMSDFFVFWQRTDRSEEGMLFCDLYGVHSLPHVCVIEPLTGRCLKVWNTRLLSDAVAVQSEFFEFVEEQQAAELAKAARAQPSGAAPPGVSAARPAAAAAEAGQAAGSPSAGEGKEEEREKDASAEAESQRASSSSSDTAADSVYSDVNSQLLELRKLREERRQQQQQQQQQQQEKQQHQHSPPFHAG